MCGVFGIFGHDEAANLTYLGLHALQHRGQESAGIVSAQGGRLHGEHRMGLVGEAFDKDALAQLPGRAAVGHVRYSTAGSSDLANCQPILVSYRGGDVAVGHNGNLTNAAELRAELELSGSIFRSTSDTEVLVHLLAQHAGDPVDALAAAVRRIEGAYSLVVLTGNALVAVRDPHGFRPLVLGDLGGVPVVASETCALDLLEANFVREIAPGEALIIDERGMRSLQLVPPKPAARCIFEHVYFARPDSNLFGRNVYLVRKELGRELAREHPGEADLVIPVPDSGVPAAIGFAEELSLPFDMGLIRSHYVGRTFIEPQDSIRHFGVKLKLNPARELLAGKRVVVIDDSLVRGTTARKIVGMLRHAGAREIHLRISSPPTVGPCHYGIDTPTREELIANQRSVEQIRAYVTADSVGYLSVEGLHRAVARGEKGGYCDACFTNRYPVAPPQALDQERRRLRVAP